MKIIIQKFGGTSLATKERREQAYQKIINAKNNYDGVVVVVSAMGRKGEPYATDTLLGLINSHNTHLTNREVDMLMACGEIISSAVIANDLNGKGVQTEAITGALAGIITDCNYTDANVIGVDAKEIVKLLSNNKVVIVTGFQGRGTNFETTTLGRGGSDLSAVLLAEALKADATEIYTDVDGIMTADPNVCNTAKIISHISYEDIFQMADSGAKVIDKKAVEIARRSGINVHIKNTFSEHEGTLITWYNQVNKKAEDKIITAIAHRKDRIQLKVEGDIDDKAFFEELARDNISIDIINIFPKLRVFTIDSKKKIKVLEVINRYDVDYSIIENCCKVTVIGERMTGVPGVMARIIRSLNTKGIEILQTADSLSTIACLIYEDELVKAVNALHDEFDLE